ncbi:MAG TPA: hypothetical protein VF175_12725 [Lacipirellula sp.]
MGNASGEIRWNWSFAGEAGQFVTGGVLDLDPIDPINYPVLDYSVTQSATGATLGSASGGEYFMGSFASQLPSFTWDGDRVVAWSHRGVNGFLWNAYEDLDAAVREHYFFGWALDSNGAEIEDASSAAHWRTGGVVLAAGEVTVAPVVVPEPAAATASLALLICCIAARRHWTPAIIRGSA